MLHMAWILDMPTNGTFLLREKYQQIILREQALLRRNEIGFIFQRFNLLSQLSALENVMLPYDKTRCKKARKLLEKMGLNGKESHLPAQLSGGEQQGVSIARALINDPSLILADEPTGKLDTRNADIIMNILRDLNKNEGVTIISVTHSQMAADFADRIFQMNDGKIIEN